MAFCDKKFTVKLLAGLAVFVMLASAGCAHDKKRSQAMDYADAADRVLASVEAGVAQGDASALADLWEPGTRQEAAARIGAGLEGPRVAGISVTLVSVRVVDGEMSVQGAWSGTLNGEAVTGRFGLRLLPDQDYAIAAAVGEVPWAVTGRTGPLAPSGAVGLEP